MLPLILGGLGAASNIYKAGQDREQAKRDRMLQATTYAFSPWTKLNGGDVKITQADNNITAGLGGALAGAQMGQGLSKAFGGSAPVAPVAPAAPQVTAVDNSIARMGSADDLRMLPQQQEQAPTLMAEGSENPFSLRNKKNKSKWGFTSFS